MVKEEKGKGKEKDKRRVRVEKNKQERMEDSQKKLERIAETNKKDQALNDKFLKAELTVLDPKGIAYSDKEGIVQIINKGKKLAPILITQGCFRASGIQALIDDGRLKMGKGEKDE